MSNTVSRASCLSGSPLGRQSAGRGAPPIGGSPAAPLLCSRRQSRRRHTTVQKSIAFNKHINKFAPLRQNSEVLSINHIMCTVYRTVQLWEQMLICRNLRISDYLRDVDLLLVGQVRREFHEKRDACRKRAPRAGHLRDEQRKGSIRFGSPLSVDATLLRQA